MKNRRLPKKGCLVMVLLSAPFLVSSFLVIKNRSFSNTFQFPHQLSDFDLFLGEMRNLEPKAGIEILELNSSLFTDYTEKQRLLKLPTGTKMVNKGDGLPKFPDGTTLIKTFYWNVAEKDSTRRKNIIETRLLVKKNGKWNVATYKWNGEQSDAYLLEKGTTVQFIVDTNGVKKKVAYKVPSTKDCISCHKVFDALQPIGPKIYNLNRMVQRNGNEINQIQYLLDNHLLDTYNPVSLGRMANYPSRGEDLSTRARAYLDINCAHCHSPGGIASLKGLNLSYETPFGHTGMQLKGLEVLQRMQVKGPLHMPKIGTSISHEEGILLISQYMESLKEPH